MWPHVKRCEWFRSRKSTARTQCTLSGCVTTTTSTTGTQHRSSSTNTASLPNPSWADFVSSCTTDAKTASGTDGTTTAPAPVSDIPRRHRIVRPRTSLLHQSVDHDHDASEDDEAKPSSDMDRANVPAFKVRRVNFSEPMKHWLAKHRPHYRLARAPQDWGIVSKEFNETFRTDYPPETIRKQMVKLKGNRHRVCLFSGSVTDCSSSDR